MAEDTTTTSTAEDVPAPTETTTPRNTKHTVPNPNNTTLQSNIAKHLHLSPLLVAEIIRTLFSMIAFGLAGFICTFAIQWSDYRWKTSGDDMIPLVDLGFIVIPETKQVFLADLFMSTLLVGSLVTIIYLAESNIARLIIFRRIFWMLAFLLSFRMVTLSVTTLPSPKKPCNPLEPGNFFQMLGTGVKLIAGSVKACTDNIFSGHSIFITTSVILLRVYCRNKYIVYYSYIHGLAALSFLIATRIHYTVDVLLAVFITYSAHSIYFFIVDLCIEKHFLNIRRAEDRLGDTELYQRTAYMPMMFNISLVGAVRWMDGLDIRFSYEGEELRDKIRERARPHVNSNTSSSGEMTDMMQVVVTNEESGEPSSQTL